MRNFVMAGPARWIAVLAVACAGAVSLASAQESEGEEESANRIIARLSSGTLAELQYSRFIVPPVSGDLDFQVLSTGPSVGLSVFPLAFLFGQARIGIPLFQEAASPDGPPPFDPDYMVVLRGGFLWHIRDSRVDIELAAGKVLVIQRDYCPTCGGFLPAGTPPPAHISETRQETIDLLSIGVVLGF